jgi:hypothetical protein
MLKLIWKTLRTKGVITAAALVALAVMVWFKGGEIEIVDGE